ncbi:MAG: precorrin-8X methylmutase [Kiloniellales bacterium]|nr:precorrin-8X methylmutase [Kiloniellales bacterium]
MGEGRGGGRTPASDKSTSGKPAPFDYLRDPEEITRRSFAIVEAEADLTRLPEPLRPLARRLVHACGMPDILEDLAWGGPVAEVGRKALEDGAPVLADCRMVAEGVTRARLRRDNAVLCTLGDPRVPALALERGTTRSAAAVELWDDHLTGAVVAIGNAPTALFSLLERLQEGAPRPAVILGFPVGFVGAAESKEALAQAALDLPFLTLRGRRGGSALAAAGVNALAAG